MLSVRLPLSFLPMPYTYETLTFVCSLDSWKRHSALVEAVMRPEDSYRKLILEILLHQVREPKDLGASSVAWNLKTYWASDVMDQWTRGGKDAGVHRSLEV
jgi:hypothetical protein